MWENVKHEKMKINNIPIKLFFYLVSFKICNRKYIRNERVYFRAHGGRVSKA